MSPAFQGREQLLRLDGHNSLWIEMPIVKTLHWPNEQACEAFAMAMVQRPMWGLALVYLQGELGAGKTTLVRHILRSMGVTGRIKSPTYAVVEPYEIQSPQAPLAVWHFDFYRFSDPLEWEDAGFRDVFASPGLKLCEWPNHAAGVLPSPDLQVSMQVNPDQSRTVQLEAKSPLGEGLLA